MAHVLFTWELGGGFGHLALIRSIAVRLLEMGHDVSVALRDLTHVHQFFSELPIRILQAPFSQVQFPGSFQPPATFPHILYNCCCGDVRVFGTLVRAWQELFEILSPDVVLFDHSPTAIFASRGASFGRATINNGFFSPPNQCPLQNWRLPAQANQFIDDEEKVLELLNQSAVKCGQAKLGQVSELYHELDACFLCTYSELDHFSPRSNGNYVGTWPTSAGNRPVWPVLQGPKVFAYLKKFESIPILLYHLVQLKLPTVVYAPGALPSEFENCFRASQSNVMLADKALDLEQVATECDFGITNGTHATVACLLRAGKPTLSFPLVLEQQVLCERVNALSAGLTVLPDDQNGIEPALHAMLNNERISQSARDFSQRHASLNGLERLVEQLQDMLMTPKAIEKTHRPTL